MLKPLRKFRQKHRTIHRLMVFFCIVALFWGGWRIFDAFSGERELEYAKAGFIALAISLGTLYLDDFHLKELE